MGLIGFYSAFIDRLAHKEAPLRALKNANPWRLTDEARAAFLQLREELAKVPTLQPVRRDRPFVLHVDASAFATGAVLLQEARDGRGLCPVAFTSHKLGKHERQYDPRKREMLAVITALKVWRHWLGGGDVQCRCFTDLKTLQWWQHMKLVQTGQIA